jgi:hypothetical protein
MEAHSNYFPLREVDVIKNIEWELKTHYRFQIAP